MSNKAMDKDYLLRQLRSFEGDVLAQKSIASEEGYHNFRYYNGAFSYKDGNTWEDIDLGNTDYVELTQQEYDQLSTAEKMNGTLYFITDGQGQSVDNSIIADEFDATESYSSGDYCIHDGKLYKFNTSHTGAWDSADADETLVSDEFGEGGGGIIDGSTVTPTDDVSTWLACAGLHQSYTTLNEVLADEAVLSALMSSTNAVDYLVRSTTWASDICANELAMGYIGANNYCADTLLADNTWSTAICNSTYFESVLTTKLPVMTSNTTPSGKITASYESSVYPLWYAIGYDDQGLHRWESESGSKNNAWYMYEFPYPMTIKKISMNMDQLTIISSVRSLWRTFIFNLLGSNDGNNFENIATNLTVPVVSGVSYNMTQNIDNNKAYKFYKITSVQYNCTYANGSVGIGTLKMWGRSDYPIGNDDAVDTNANISAIAPNEPNATSSRDYAVGEHFYKNGEFCTAITSIAQGATFTLGTNYVEGTIADSITDKLIYSTGNTNQSVTTKLTALKTAFDGLSEEQRRKSFVRINDGTNPTRQDWLLINSVGIFLSIGNSTDSLLRIDILRIAANETPTWRAYSLTTGISIETYTWSTTFDFQLWVRGK